MKHPDRTSSLFWLVVGIGITFGSLKYGFGTFLSPGAGFITFFAGSILCLLSVFLLIVSLKNRDSDSGFEIRWKGLEGGKVILVMALLGGYALVLQWLGFLITTFLLLLSLFRIKGTYSLGKVVGMSLLISIGTYLVFSVWLRVQLPKGILERVL